jgi:hypothetical protein
MQHTLFVALIVIDNGHVTLDSVPAILAVHQIHYSI